MKIIFAPSISWLSDRKNFVTGAGPDPTQLDFLLRKEGIDPITLDPHKWPWNPFSGNDTLLQSLDPLRALKIAYGYPGVDAVISVFEGAAATLGLLRPFALHRPKIIMWDIGLTDWRLRNKIINMTLPRIDHLMVLGANQIDYIAKNYAPCRSVSAIGHVVDTEFFRPMPLNSGGPVLSVGDDVGRDFLTLGKAMQGIGRTLIVKASRHPPDLTGDCVQVIRERSPYTALRDLYIEASVVVVPTKITANACGVSTILEASASGRPLVVTDNPGIRDFVVPDETCLLVPEGDVAALRSAILKLFLEPETCSRLAENARAFVVKKFSFPAFSSCLANQIKCVVQNSEPFL